MASSETSSASGFEGRDRSLDGLRVVAALAVFVYHGVTVLGPAQFARRHWDVFGMLGPLGVAIFFALSGYLLAMPFLARPLQPPRPRVFYARRLLRILPAYWLALAAFVYVWDRAQVRGVDEFVTYFGLLQNYRFGFFTGGLDVAWTLVMELSFYAFLPLWFWAARRAAVRWPRLEWHRLHLVGAAVLVAWGPIFRWWDLYLRPRGAVPARGSWFELSTITLWLPGHIHHFAIGMAGATIVHAGWVERWSESTRRRLRGTAVAAAVAGLLGVIAVDIPPQVLDGTRLQGVMFAAAMTVAVIGIALLVLVDRPRFVVAPLRIRPIAWIGQVSFGVYLWHRLIQMEIAEAFFSREPVRRLDAMIAAWTLSTVLSIAAGALSFYLVEQPAIRLGRRLR